jgi:hypothetical protein
LKLKIPSAADGYPALRLGASPVKARGRAARLRWAKENEEEARNHEALMQVALICYSLWAGFWLQFVIGVCYNIPAIHTLSSGNWYAPDYEFYIQTPGSFPFSSVAGNLVFYSAFGSAVAIVFCWIFTQGAAGKWRLRFAVAVFVTITLGWSISAYRAEEAAWNEGMDERIAKERRKWRWVADDIGREGGGSWHEFELQRARERVEKLEALKKSRGEGGN